MRVTANSIVMNYEVHGDGPDLVLVHGAGDNLGMWYHQVPAFSKTYRVITYDVRGSGGTEVAVGEYSMKVFADDTYELMKALGVPRACFLGYSMGGRVALDLAIRHPEMVKALVLVATPFGPAAPPPARGGRRGVPGFGPDGDLRSFAEAMTTSSFSPGFRSTSPAEFDRYMAVKLLNQPEGVSRLMGSLGGLSEQPDLTRLKCPVMTVFGERDLLINIERGVQASATVPGAELVVLASGHAAPIEAADEFNAAVLRFLGQH